MRTHTIPSLFCATLALAAFLPSASIAQPPQKPDAATAAWWAQTTALANDSMQGRDTGTEAYERAAKYVAAQFTSAGLNPQATTAPSSSAFPCIRSTSTPPNPQSRSCTTPHLQAPQEPLSYASSSK